VSQSLESIDVLEQKPWYTLEEKTSDKNRASVVYVQSACNSPSDRDTYVQELMKYINVDSLGKCLNNKELPEEYKDSLTFSNKSFYKIIGKYKFTLAFENAICDDYITEKLWRPLEIGSVPIYRGSPSVLDWMPNNHSVIVVDDFSNPKDLAEYIKKLDADDASYLKYLDFKQKGGVTNPRLLKHMRERKWNMVDGENSFVTGFECLVCDRVHENLKRQKSGLPVAKHMANQNHYGCPRPVEFYYPLVKGVEQFERDMWQTEFDEHKKIAKALNKAVLSGEKEFNLDKVREDDTWF
jgi:alpha-1,3-fucosyltransferase 10